MHGDTLGKWTDIIMVSVPLFLFALMTEGTVKLNRFDKIITIFKMSMFWIDMVRNFDFGY